MSASPNANATSSTPPLQWRVELIQPALPSRRLGSLRQWGTPAVLLLALLAILGSTVGLLSTLQPLPQPRLVAIWMSKPVDQRILHAPTLRDIEALTASGLFAPSGSAQPATKAAADLQGFTPASFDQQISALAGLQGDEPVIVYLSALATLDADQQVLLLAGSTLDRALESQRPLAELLEAVQRCRATHKLLILELGWQQTGSDVDRELQAQLQRLPSPNYSIVCTSSPGETARTIFEPRRSLFAYFLEQGLLGNADGFLDQRCDGRVDTHELAAYVQQTVKSYSQEVYGAQQTPSVMGDLAKFDLSGYSAANLAQSDIAVARRVQPTSDALPVPVPVPALVKVAGPAAKQTPPGSAEPSIAQVNSPGNQSEYPQWLRAAWESRDRMIEAQYYHFARQEIVQLENEIFSAELAWRDGMPEKTLQVHLERSAKELEARGGSALARFRGPAVQIQRPRSTTAGQPPLSESKPASSPQDAVSTQPTAIAANGTKANRSNPAELYASLAQFAEDAKSLSATTPPLGQAPLGQAPLAALVEEFKQANAAVSPEELTQGLFHYVRDHSQFQIDQLACLELILPKSTSGPLGLDGPFLQSLVRSADPSSRQLLTPETVQGLLKVVSLNEQRMVLPQIWPWLADIQNSCDQNRAEMEQLLWAAETNGNVTHSRLLDVLNEQQQLSTIRQRLESAYDTVAYNRLRLQQCLSVEELGHRLHPWCHAAEQSAQLEHMLLHPHAMQTMGTAHRLTATKQVNYLHAETVQLRSAMDQLLDDASAQQIRDLLRESQAVDVGAEHLLHLQRLLSTTLPTAEQRAMLHAAARSLATKVHYQALQSMQLSPPYEAATGQPYVDTRSATDAKSPPHIAHAQNLHSQTLQARKLHAWKLQTQLAAEQPPLSYWDKHLREVWSGSERLYFSLARSNPKIDYYAATAQLYRIEAQRGSAPQAGLQRNLQRNLQRGSQADEKVGLQRGSQAGSQAGLQAGLQSGLPYSERGHFVATRERVLQQQVVAPPRAQAASGTGVSVDWLPASATCSTPLDALRLRTLPGHQAYRLRLTNKSDRPQTLIVELSSAAEKLTSNAIPLAPGECLPVTFAGQPPKPEDMLAELTALPSVRVLDATTRKLLLEQAMTVEIATPREYVEVLSATFTPYSIGRNQLEIWLRATQPLTAGPCIATLSLDPAKIDGLVSVTSGKLQAELDPTGQPTRLLAEGLVFKEDTDNAGIFEIAIDGVARAFRFHCNFTRVGQPTTPRLLMHPSLQLLASSAVRTGGELPVRLQVDSAPRQSTLELRLSANHQVPGGIDRSYNLSTPQQHRLGFAAATGGDLLLSAELNDWVVQLDTNHIVGKRQLLAVLASHAGVLAEAKQPLALDDRPPQYLQFVRFPERAAAGSAQRVVLSAESLITGIDSVQLLAGSLVDGKVPSGLVLHDCQCVASSERSSSNTKQNQSLWSTELTWPEQLGAFTVTAIATNGAGLQTFSSLKLTAVTAAELNFGSIQGVVQEGSNPQPGLDVLLVDSAGQMIAKVKSHVDGTFAFATVAAGDYRLFAEKPSSRRSAQQQVRVQAGEIAAGNLSLRLAR